MVCNYCCATTMRASMWTLPVVCPRTLCCRQVEDQISLYIDKILYCFLPLSLSLQWGEMPTSVAYIGTGQIMGWGNKAIEVRTVERNISWALNLWILILSADTFGWERSSGWCFHAQEGATLEIPVRAQRQSILQQCQRCFIVSNLLHDAQQAGHGQLVESGCPCRLRCKKINNNFFLILQV